MTPTRRSALVVVSAAVLCFGASVATNDDPLYLVEVGGTLVVLSWAAAAARLVMRSHLLARGLAGQTAVQQVAGLECRVIEDPARHVFVAGAVRPSLFVTSGTLGALTPDEVRAVLLHEVHHARTLAPVRAAVVHAWRVPLCRVPVLGALLAARLEALEIDADRHALTNGATRRHLASALVKLDSSVQGVPFTGGGDGRLRALLGDHAAPAQTAPVEWLPLFVVIALSVGCRLAGTALGV